MAAVPGGLVFTGGIGEHDAATRDAIAQGPVCCETETGNGVPGAAEA